jgi:hypothetical protein
MNTALIGLSFNERGIVTGANDFLGAHINGEHEPPTSALDAAPHSHG